MKYWFICLFLAYSELNAQVGNENVSFSTGNFFLRGNRPSSKEYLIDGNPYPDGDSFQTIKIDGYSKNVQQVRYNAYEDEMEFLQNGQIYYTFKEEGLKIQFPSLKKTYQCTNYSYDNNTKFGYLVLLIESSKYSLYKREKVELLKGEKSPNAFSKDANDYFAKEKDLYLVKNNGQFFRLPKNLKNLISQFSFDGKDTEDYVKTNKVNYTKEEDLIKLFNYINSK